MVAAVVVAPPLDAWTVAALSRSSPGRNIVMASALWGLSLYGLAKLVLRQQQLRVAAEAGAGGQPPRPAGQDLWLDWQLLLLRILINLGLDSLLTSLAWVGS